MVLVKGTDEEVIAFICEKGVSEPYSGGIKIGERGCIHQILYLLSFWAYQQKKKGHQDDPALWQGLI